VERSPESVALLFEQQRLSYREMNARANQVAHHLRALGVRPEVAVGICMERSPEMMLALLGILKAGGAYVPLDPAYPKDQQTQTTRRSVRRPTRNDTIGGPNAKSKNSKSEKEANPMEGKKCLRTLAVLRRKVLGYGCFGVLRRGVSGSGRWSAALIIAIATLAWASGAAADTCKAIHVFTGTAGGAGPTGNLTFDAAGNLYGTTFEGGGSACGGRGCGVVWKLRPNPKGTWTVSILHVFTGADGANPYLAGLTFDAAGNLYGTTSNGGTDGRGVVFKLAPNPDGTWTESVLHSFTGADGNAPQSALIFDAAGNLYSTTDGGGADQEGVVFKLTPNSDGTWTENVLYSFTGYGDGSNPNAPVIFDAAGNLYGTTFAGGGEESGVAFKLAPNPDGTWTESVIYSFFVYVYPKVGLIVDAAGNLYGTAGYGEGYYHGVVYELKPNPDGTWTYSVLYGFTGHADGGNPSAGLIFDVIGNLYSTTFGGGYANYGVVFKLTPTSSGWSETVLHSFKGTGVHPQAPLIFDPAGNLYGTTAYGTNNNGLVFEITGVSK
jgi:uncharacterized repeat protein (TIGR03803 family)